MNKVFLFISMCFIWVYAIAEEPQRSSDTNLFGHVVDKSTNEHLAFINVVIKGSTIGATTDATGHYYLKNLPEGEFTIVVQSIGYRTVEKRVTLARGKSVELNFEIEEDRIAIDGVVVSANRSETTRRLAPSLVNVLDANVFSNTNSLTLAQGLNFQPGVRVENNCQNCGLTQVRINGLDGPYTQILIDSRPVFSALSGVYGLEQLPANMIERVEVMRGGGSALFGSSAIAGTINIITKEPNRNSGELVHAITSIGGSGSFDNNTSLNASLVTDNRKIGLYVFGQNRHRSAYDHDGDGYTETPMLKNQTVGFRSYIKTTDYSKVTVEYHHLEEFRRGGNKLDVPPHEADITEQVQHSVDGGSVKFDIFSNDYKHKLNVFVSAMNTSRGSYYGTGKDPNAYGKTTDLTALAGTQYSYDFDRFLFMPSQLMTGIEYNSDHLEDEMLGYERHTNQKVRIGSLFLQNEWKNKMWSILIGGRLDKHNLIDKVVFSPRANLRFNPTEDINIRVSYSSGFRAPQAFDEDLHIAAVGGEVALIRRSEDLKEEKSHSLSTSVDIYRRFGGVQVNFLAEGFYTKLKDVFVLEDIGQDQQGNLIKERRNGSGAQVMGVTLEGKAVLTSWLSLQAGFTFQNSKYDKPEKWSEDETIPASKKMFRTPDKYGYFTSTITPFNRFTAFLSGTYTGSMLVQHLAGYIPKDESMKTSGFFDMTLKLAYGFPLYRESKLEVSAGVQNLFDAYQSDFDKGADRDATYIYGPSFPRSYFGGVKISF
ncbi:MAG: TonB-dependent receptor [Tannerellaceae bacterium]|jgi:outer membrane receptor for ferrienterochelin and colicins|nr:TonB-dependent receptor [Tannerellaceae bacterium]